MNKPLKILSIPVDKGGCGWYRVRQPFQAIEAYTDSKAHVIDKEADDPIAILQALCEADIFLVRQGGEMGVEPLRQAANDYAKEAKLKQGFHAKIVLDIDDNIELISPYSEHYGEYGTRDFYDNGTKQWVWKEGVTKDFDLARNRSRIMNLMWGLKKADAISVTTPVLAEYAKQFNDTVLIMPNVINADTWWEPNFAPKKKLRVGWTGGHSHYEDWYTIKQPLNTLLRKYRFTLVMAGTGFEGLIDPDLRKYVEVFPWVAFEAHSYRTMLLNLDLAIIPLSDSPFNSYKSAIKYFEFSGAGVPCIVSNVTPYKEVIDADRAFRYSSEEEFASQLENAIKHPYARDAIADAAHGYVLRNWTTKVWAQKYVEQYSGIL